jgi:hypothetical protein
LKPEIERTKGSDVTLRELMSLVLVGRQVYRLLNLEAGEKVCLLKIDPSIDATSVPTREDVVKLGVKRSTPTNA